MKNWLIITLLVAGSLSTLGADEKTAVWDRIYRNAVNDDMRFSVLLNIRDLHDKQFGGLLTDALSDLVSRRIENGTSAEVESKVRLAMGLVQELGELKEVGSADQVFQVYKDTVGYPFLKAEAAMALGKMRAIDYVANLARDLADLNLQPDRDKAAAQEIVAFGLVQSLATMKDARGFEPVFFASIGWYGPQRKVKEMARSMLKGMVTDPTEPLLKILKDQPAPANKFLALQAEADSTAPDAGKARVALAALEDGVRTIAANLTEASQWSDLRKKALVVLAQTKDKTPAAAALLRQQYKTAALARDNTEILSVILALGVNGTPDALAYLIELMDGFNNRSQTPGLLTDFDLQQIRSVLAAFKVAASAAARPVLLQAKFSPYTPAMVKEIDAVLTGLPN